VSERCIHPDYEIRGKTYELWIDSDRNWSFSSEDSDMMMIESDFDPPLTEAEMDRINRFVDDWLTPD
jgi:hypothetical protein